MDQKSILNKKLATIQVTKDYDMFKLYNYNRAVMVKRVDEIVESILKYGFLLPILVNEDFLVIDGQHRLEAARKTGVELSYIQVAFPSQAIPLLIATVNSTSTNWKLPDYLNMWEFFKKPAYVSIRDYISKHFIKIYAFLQLANVASMKDQKKFRDGTLSFSKSQIEKIEKKLAWLEEIVELIPEDDKLRKSLKTCSQFRQAIIQCLIHPDYDHKRMMKVLMKSPGSLQKQRSMPMYVEVLEMLYNNKGLAGRAYNAGLRFSRR